MTNNYRTHLEIGLYEAHKDARQLIEQAQIAEAQSRRSRERRMIYEAALKVLREQEARDAEFHRRVHALAMTARQRVGEYESELFSSEEEREEWFRRHCH